MVADGFELALAEEYLATYDRAIALLIQIAAETGTRPQFTMVGRPALIMG